MSPPPAAPVPSRGPNSAPSPDGRRRRERRALGIGLGASLLAHVLLFLLLESAWVAVPPGGGEPPRDELQVTGMRAVAVQPVPSEALPPQETEEPEPVPERRRVPFPEAPSQAPPAAVPEAAPQPPRGAVRRPTPVERIRPGERDPRLYGMPDPLAAPHLTPEEARRLRFQAAVNALNDSAQAAVAAAAAATDWTVTDEDGGRWGVSPGRIHLGTITLPLPFALQAPAGPARDEASARQRAWRDIHAQAARAGVLEEFEARVEAIRARREAERKKEKSGNE